MRKYGILVYEEKCSEKVSNDCHDFSSLQYWLSCVLIPSFSWYMFCAQHMFDWLHKRIRILRLRREAKRAFVCLFRLPCLLVNITGQRGRTKTRKKGILHFSWWWWSCCLAFGAVVTMIMMPSVCTHTYCLGNEMGIDENTMCLKRISSWTQILSFVLFTTVINCYAGLHTCKVYTYTMKLFDRERQAASKVVEFVYAWLPIMNKTEIFPVFSGETFGWIAFQFKRLFLALSMLLLC